MHNIRAPLARPYATAYCQSAVNSVSRLADKNDWTEKSANHTAELATDYGYPGPSGPQSTLVRANGFLEPQSPPLDSQNPIPIPNFFYLKLEIHFKSALYPTINLLTSRYILQLNGAVILISLHLYHHIFLLFAFKHTQNQARFCQVMFWRSVPFINVQDKIRQKEAIHHNIISKSEIEMTTDKTILYSLVLLKWNNNLR